MEKMEFRSKDLVNENLKKIANLFPNVVSEGKIDFDKLKQELTNELVEGDESYDFTWVGKKNSVIEANKPTTKTLRPCIEESENFYTTENLYIEGDNLEVLKILQKSYFGKIKCIYIDPPYNTGNDFIYNDDFKMESDEYKDKSGEVDDEGNRLFKNTDSNGRFHSDWCSMIYSRLKLAYNLLSEDGIIFISIDENEIDNLQKICDEVFSEYNKITTFVWEKTQHMGRQKVNYYSNIEYVLCYAKKLKNSTSGIKELLVESISNSLDDAPLYNDSNPEKELLFPKHSVKFNIDDGIYDKTTDEKYTLINQVEVKNGINENDFKLKFRSRWTAEKVIEEYNKGCTFWVKTNNFAIRTIYQEDKTTNVSPKQMIFTNSNNEMCAYSRFKMKVGTNEEGSAELKQLLGKDIFSYPKPVSYIAYLLSMIFEYKNEEYNKDFMALDFFSGSATTAHAVMKLNAEDGGNRKFIMVQLPEETGEDSEAYKAGYKKICEIGKERIRRAGKKILEENKDKEGIKNLDIGFRVLKLSDSNMKDVYYNPDDYSQDLISKLTSNIKDDRNEDDLLFASLLDRGIDISKSYRKVDIDGKKVIIYNEEGEVPEFVACFDNNITEKCVTEIAKLKPLKAIFRDSSFGSSSDRINVEEIFKLYSKDTRVSVM